jgi:hypothetical protein
MPVAPGSSSAEDELAECCARSENSAHEFGLEVLQ